MLKDTAVEAARRASIEGAALAGHDVHPVHEQDENTVATAAQE